MYRTSRVSKVVSKVAVPLAAVLLVSSVTGCHWFKKKNELYTQSTEARPLEVPPDLDRPSADRAMNLPDANAGKQASAPAQPAANPTGFTVAGERDAVFAKLGEVLAATNGVRIASKADILGTYDVDYLDSKFLVRVTKTGDKLFIAAVDPRGLPPSGAAAGKLIALLKAALAP